MEFFNRSRPGTAAQGVGVAQGGWRGCRIVVSLIDEMEKRGLKLGVAALCGGGGHDQAILLKRI